MLNELKTFVAIGIINTIVGLSSIYFFFNIVGLNYWFSTLIGNGVGMMLSYFLNRKFTFKYKENSGKSFLKFFIVVLSCYYISYWLGLHITDLCSPLFSNYIDLKGNFSILLGSGLYTISNYFGQKFFVFNKRQNVLQSN
jgi:putative flippase GtrA